MPYEKILDISDGGEVRFFEDPANGKNYIAVRGPESQAGNGTLVLRNGSTALSETAYTVVDGDRIVLVDDDTAGGAVTVTLPPAATNARRELAVKKLGTTGTVTIAANGTELIDGDSTLVIVFQYDAPQLYCDGAGWWVI
jgi:hypothetical protein